MPSIFASNKTDDKNGFYRIIQPLRFLKRSGWKATTIPFTGTNDVSILPIHDELLVRLSESSDFILTSVVLEERELLKIMDLRKLNNSKWIVDVSENIYENPMLSPYLPIIERSIILADGVITSTPINKEAYSKLNKNVYLLPSALDFNIWDSQKPVVSKNLKIGYYGGKQDLDLISPALQELAKKYKLEFVDAFIDGVIGQPEALSKLGLSMCLFPLIDNNYTRCQNNINLLEVMALKVPIIASPIDSLDGLPVMYANSNYEWYETIEKLITDTKFRKAMGQNGYEFVKSVYDMKLFVSNLQKWLKELPRKEY
jgi:glycosyltransferase involved in cell wall biosynthesis